MNLEKQQGFQNTIKKLVIDDKEITDQMHVLEHIKKFYEKLFKKREQTTAIEKKIFFLKLSENQTKLREVDLTKKDLYISLKNMQNDKSPDNDGLTKEFYETL